MVTTYDDPGSNHPRPALVGETGRYVLSMAGLPFEVIRLSAEEFIDLHATCSKLGLDADEQSEIMDDDLEGDLWESLVSLPSPGGDGSSVILLPRHQVTPWLVSLNLSAVDAAHCARLATFQATMRPLLAAIQPLAEFEPVGVAA